MTKRVAAVVLAAGSSSRLGRPKQLIEFRGQTLLRRTAQTVLASLADALVVTTGDNGVDSEVQLCGLNWTRAAVVNAQEGQSNSVRAGLEAVESLGEFEAILFTPCDLPLLSAAHLNALIEKYRSANWNMVASRYDETSGAPMIVSHALWPELRGLRGDVGARRLLAFHAQRATFVEWPDGRFDMDTPDDVGVMLAISGADQGESQAIPLVG